ncbi:hypothetical protein T4A_7238 [Trichinella pseudospiralis]|nr:hypothetical protein T4A_7238 [Trichinella pseudospiralis]KRZ38261.1 hypothetical protein T4C_10935 [Trichinella pseudospiralis]
MHGVSEQAKKWRKENCLLWISGIPVYVSKLLGQSEAASLSENQLVRKFRVLRRSQTDSRCNWGLFNRFIYSSTLSEGSTKLARLVENLPRQSANGGVDTSATFFVRCSILLGHKIRSIIQEQQQQQQ